MKHHLALSIALSALLVWQNCQAGEDTRHEADVCVYGGTASGVMAALAAEKEGAKVILIEPSRWLGGMTGGGINHLDWGKGNTVGGSTYKILMEGLEKQARGHRGNAIVGIGHIGYRERFKKAVEGRGITVIYDHRLGKVDVGDSTIDSPTRQRPISLREQLAESKKGNSIRSITLDYAPVDETGCPIPEPKQRHAVTVAAKVFIDCSYEGDLLAMSGVNYTWGRESREHYNESLAGVRPSLWVHDIDPYVEPGNPESGLVPFVQDRKIGPPGSADSLSMGYGYRYEFDMSGKGIPIPEPVNYDPAEFELYRRAVRDGIDIFSKRKMDTLGKITELKRGPFVGGAQSNRNLMGSTVYGCNDEYPNGDWATRSRIWKFHQEFLSKSIHFAKTDPSAPKSMKQKAMKISFRKGPFDETGGWPNQLYVRQARRMVSSYVVTQKDLEGKTDPPHTVGLAAYGVDDWPYAVVVEDGKVALQGGEFSIVYLDNGKYNGSYKIPYEAIVPRKGECDNLLVPVCVSASHIAFTSIRMEPVWMNLGESAGVAAAMAVDAEIPVQDVPYKKLRQKLEDLDQTLDRTQDPIQDQKKPDQSARWKSQDDWNKQKKGWEWLFPHIDTDSDGQISAKEYNAFQKFKAEHDDWEELLRKKGARTPTGLLPRDKPNIVLIFADDLGIETLNAYGGHGVRTPHLDKLATSGMLFTHCFANPACSPSRAEIMTGTYPGFAGIKHVLTHWDDDTYLDPKKFNSFANQLKEVGYATAVAGKWNLSWLERNDTVKAFGFDEHCLWQMYDRNGTKRSRYYKPHFRINGNVEEASIAERFGPDVLTDFMIDFMKRKKDGPFLVYYPALLVHTPYIRVPGGSTTRAISDREQKNGPECFPEMVEYLDKNVGRLVNAVDELGLRNDTVILFCADNGTHGPVTSVWGENRTKIKGGKMTMTDRGSRVPLIASWPGTIKPGTQCDDLVELADFLPTFLDIASAPKPMQRVHGQSFLPQLVGGKGPSKDWVHIEYKNNRQIRTKEWIYTDKGRLTRVSELGRPENRPEKEGDHADARNKMKRIFALIDKSPPSIFEEKQPNFIVILTDDQGWGTTSITVDPAVPESKSDFFKTPNLEKLASQGLRFTQAYSGHPNCSPSRAALLTGRSPAALHFTDICGRNGGGLYVGNKIIPPQHINALPEGELTLPEIIKQHLPAYKAAHFGKWHLGKVGPEGHGFDAGDGPTGNREGSGKDNLPDDPKRIFSVTKRANDWMAEQAKGKQPFYLQVSHYATHLGLQSRPETKQRVDKRPSGTRHQNTEFGAMIEDMDDGIGQLLAKVKELGIGDNTYIFYTADNGTFPLEEPGNINGPLRGNKATVWEAGVRVPFIIAGPGIESGTVSRAPAVGYDIYPTICDILGIADLPEQVEGGSLQPVWAAKAASVKRSRPQLVFHWPHYQHQKKSIPDSTVLLDGYKLHYFWETGKAELYNLKTDLAETKDLSRSMPEKAKELEGLLHSHLKEINAQIPELNKDYDPATDPALVKVKKPKDKKKKKNRS